MASKIELYGFWANSLFFIAAFPSFSGISHNTYKLRQLSHSFQLNKLSLSQWNPGSEIHVLYEVRQSLHKSSSHQFAGFARLLFAFFSVKFKNK